MVRKINFFVFFLYIIFGFSAKTYAANVCPEFPYFEPKDGPLAFINCDFHKQYEKRIHQLLQTFGAPYGRPVILNLGGTLVLKYNGKTETVPILPAPYHALKTFGHATFSVYLTLSQNQEMQLTKELKNTLQELKAHLDNAASKLSTFNLSNQDQNLVKKIVQLTDNFVNELLQKNTYTQHEIKNYYEQIHPLILQTIYKSAELELNLLSKTVEGWLAQMRVEDRKLLGIVVATAHQPRAQEISLQYFAKKFGHHFGEGALHENGLVVLEGKFDEASALQLLARHYLDRDVAQLILNDPELLQKDLLADAGTEILKS